MHFQTFCLFLLEMLLICANDIVLGGKDHFDLVTNKPHFTKYIDLLILFSLLSTSGACVLDGDTIYIMYIFLNFCHFVKAL